MVDAGTVTFPSSPPERIELPNGCALVRCRADRAPAAVVAINESLDHLRPWMAWAAEPATDGGMAVFFAVAEDLWDRRRDFSYTIVDGTGEVVGGCGLHGRQGPDALDIGYWVHVDHVGRGLATAVARGLTGAAFAIAGIARLQITCEEHNLRSARVPEKLGYGYCGLTVPENGPCEGRSTQVWVLERAAWMAGAAGGAP